MLQLPIPNVVTKAQLLRISCTIGLDAPAVIPGLAARASNCTKILHSAFGTINLYGGLCTFLGHDHECAYVFEIVNFSLFVLFDILQPWVQPDLR